MIQSLFKECFSQGASRECMKGFTSDATFEGEIVSRKVWWKMIFFFNRTLNTGVSPVLIIEFYNAKEGAFNKSSGTLQFYLYKTFRVFNEFLDLCRKLIFVESLDNLFYLKCFKIGLFTLKILFRFFLFRLSLFLFFGLLFLCLIFAVGLCKCCDTLFSKAW